MEWQPTDAPRDRGGGPPDEDLLGSLRTGDEAAFLTLVDRHHASMVRLARLYVSDEAQAEDVAQEAWLGLLRGLDRFEGRSSLRTWLFHILTNIAKTRGRREARSIPFSALWDASAEPKEPAVDPDAFLPADHPEWPGHWRATLPSWSELPESRLLSRETREHLDQAIDELPPSQREVITLRDVEGWTADEVCNNLAISETNQRVLLHRARSKVRRALDAYLHEG